jgi:hypothetical protein
VVEVGSWTKVKHGLWTSQLELHQVEFGAELVAPSTVQAMVIVKLVIAVVSSVAAYPVRVRSLLPNSHLTVETIWTTLIYL